MAWSSKTRDIFVFFFSVLPVGEDFYILSHFLLRNNNKKHK